jgi:hypothetical protein
MSKPKLLRIPKELHTVEEVLAVAGELDIEQVLVIAETKDGGLVLLENGMTLSQVNWLCDRTKHFILDPAVGEDGVGKVIGR